MQSSIKDLSLLKSDILWGTHNVPKDSVMVSRINTVDNRLGPYTSINSSMNWSKDNTGTRGRGVNSPISYDDVYGKGWFDVLSSVGKHSLPFIPDLLKSIPGIAELFKKNPKNKINEELMKLYHQTDDVKLKEAILRQLQK